jgi:hypothetical protein
MPEVPVLMRTMAAIEEWLATDSLEERRCSQRRRLGLYVVTVSVGEFEATFSRPLLSDALAQAAQVIVVDPDLFSVRP